VAGVRRFAPSRPARLRPCHQARALRWVRAGGRWHRGSRAHLRDVHAPRRLARAGRHPGEELWVKIIDLDLARRRISLSIKQAAEGGELAEEYRQHFEIDEHGNWTAGQDDAEREAAWAEYYQENPDEKPPTEADAEVAVAEVEAEAAPEA
jgi:hypothetical protein